MERDDNREQFALVEIIDGGPLRIKGNIILKDLRKDTEEKHKEVYLCRCGNSCNKPYCDSSHRT